MRLRGASSAVRTAAVVVLCACGTVSAQEQQPAILTTPSVQSIAELNRIVSDALHGMPVRLADDALTHDSVLIVERIQPRDAAGLPLNGRELGKPEHFHLVKRGSQCILIHERTRKRWILSAATCAPADGSH
jgi:hypothetical protein